MSTPELEPARPSIPDYELLRRIGQGGYGDVWLARGVTGLYRAIKVVWRARFSDAAPFEREFKGLTEFAAISLGESIQLALLHIGRNDEAGFFYYVMELADDADRGRDVDPARYVPLTLTEVRRRRGRVPADECVNYGVELARVLAGLHARGLVHRDIKPSNVILVGGVAKVADIGLVTTAAEARTFIGTEGFVPPEGPGAPAGDVFALGKLLYELSTGLDREEFPRLPPELDKIPDRPRLLALNAVILRACEPEVKRRYPDGGAMLADLRRLQARGGGWLRRTMIAVAAVFVVAGAVLWWRAHSNPPIVQSVSAGPRSIAVLPFENMNEDKEDAFFADGIHEEILTDLANIASLRVISRTSVMHYRNTKKSMAEIARELGADFILEGSVRRVGQRVRVTGQLIRAAADEQVWAKAYDGEMSDILGLQARMATTIAEQLKAVLTPDESKRLNGLTLADPAAYELYLRGRDLRRRQDDPMNPNPEAETLFRQATQLDPKFVLPWVELASLHVMRYFEEGNPSERELAKQALDRAVALAPDRAEVAAGLGEYYYYDFTDFENAAKHYQRALALEPSNARVHQLLGLLARRQLRWREAIDELRQAHELDPLNRGFFAVLRSTLAWSHDYPAARALVAAEMKLDPHGPKAGLDGAYFDANITLSRQPLDAWLAAQSPAYRSTPDCKEAEGWIAYDSGEAGRYVSLADPDPAASPETFDPDATASLAIAMRVLGRDASGLLARGRKFAEAAVKATPNAPGRWSDLALLCALQGDRARGMACLDRALELGHANVDLLHKYGMDVLRAKMLAWLGDKDAAVTLLSSLVRTPGPNTDPFELRFSLDWWPLRGDPRFEALLADPATRGPWS